MYLVELLLIILWMMIVPFLVGALVINKLFKEKVIDLLLAIVCGAICMLAVFYILVIPMLYLKMSLNILVISWSVIMLILCGLSIAINRGKIKDAFRNSLSKIRNLSFIAVLVILLVIAQGFLAAYYQHSDADDAFFVAASATAISTDSIFQFDPYSGLPIPFYPPRYVLAPFPIFVAVLSKVMLIHPTIISHTIFPAVLIPLSYIIWGLLGRKFFPGRSISVFYFMLFLCVLNIFGNTSIYTNATFLLFRIWQGKSVLANIVIPAILYFSYRTMPKDSGFGAWLMLFACALAACLVSSMGVVLAFFMIIGIGVVFSFQNKKINSLLYSIACSTPCIVCAIVTIIR